MFWRAIEKSDMTDLGVERGGRPGESWDRSSLVQGSPKRNTPMARVTRGDALVPGRLCGSESDLFDGNRKPSDQPCDLVQLLGILRLNGLRKPDEALVIAHRGYVAWNDRRHRPYQAGQQVWHRITSNGSNRCCGTWSGIKSFWRSVRGAGKPVTRPAKCRTGFFGSH